MVISFQCNFGFRWLIAAIGMLTFASLCRAAEVEAGLDRPSVVAGNGAILSIRVSGGSADQIQIPPVADLIVQQRGQNQKMQIVNGHVTNSVTYDYVVGSRKPGDYQIPAITVTVGGKPISTRPLQLKVLANGAPQPPAGTPAVPGAEPEDDTSGNRFGFLTVQLAGAGRKHAYVGEIAPVIIRAWLPAESRAQLRSGIQPEGNGFTLHNVSERPQQTQEIKDGKRYLVVTWYGGISATKAGKLPASLSVDAIIAIRDTAALKRPRQRRGGPFDDPFFDDMFQDLSVPMIQKDVTLQSENQEIEVLSLPTEGRPADFTGAVGDFKFASTGIPSTWKTGEPNQVTARLTGSGNFALLNAPTLIPAAAWKLYPGKDEFSPGDQASFSGTKNFRFSAVPKKGGAQDAALTFSYFDPAAEAYKTVTSPRRQIQVTGKDLVEIVPSDPESAAREAPKKPTGGLVAQHVERAPAATLVPLVDRPAFVSILGISAGLCALGKFLTMVRIRREDPRRQARAAMEAATRSALDTAGKCAAANDVAGYFAAARLALQQQLGALWNQSPQAITLAEIETRLPGDSPVARFFREADRWEYNRTSSGEILPQWRALLDESLTSLTPSSPLK